VCRVDVNKKELFLKPLSSIEKPFQVEVYGEKYLLETSEGLKITYR
jgi:hypothetical protein